MRAFIALELPEGFSWELSQLARGLARHAEGHFVNAESYHVTLAFLGDIGEAQARDAVGALDAACAGRAGVPLASAGLGSFGRGRSTTLYLALRKEPQEIVDLCLFLASEKGQFINGENIMIDGGRNAMPRG